MPVKNTHYLDVDTKLTNHISVPRVTQNDDVFFIVRILDDGRPVPLTNVQTFLLASLKPNKETILTVGTVSEDEISFKIESAALNVKGRVQASVQLYYTDGRTSTIPFYYEVIADSSVDYVPDTSETSLIQLVLGDAPFVIEAAQSATIGAEDAAAQTLEALDNFDTEKSVAIQELDDVKEENKTNWKQEVATVALRNSTYPNPQIGDTVRITGEARIDRFNGTEWITTDRYNPAVVDNLTVKLAEEAQKVEALNLDKAGKTEVDLALAAKVNKTEVQAIASSFKESYETVALLQAAYPNGDTSNHAVLSDGFIYTFKESWISTGILANGTGIARKSITPDKLSFTALPAKLSKNLFNKSDILPDSYLVDDTGKTFTFSGYFTSGFIAIEPNTAYANNPLNSKTRVSYYDLNKNYISRATDAATTFTTPPNAYFIRVSYINSALNIAQIEKGNAPTSYQEFGAYLDEKTIKDNSFDSANFLKDGAISFNKLAAPVVQGVLGKNLFNKDKIEMDKYFDQATGLTFNLAGYFASEFIAVTPQTTYHLQALAAVRRINYYSSEKAYLGFVDGATTFTTPPNAYFIRYSSRNSDLELSQIEKGSTFSGYETFGYKISKEKLTGVAIIPKVLYTLSDAWTYWLRGEKFPIAITGDSTIDGLRTTGATTHTAAGVTDNKNPNAFPFLLEGLLRQATDNSTLRIYNAGHTGMNSSWALSNIATEFSGTSVYADVKMAGIGYGINDRQLYTTQKAFRDGFKSNIRSMIEWFYAKGIQPFLLTTQAILEAGVKSDETPTYPLRTAEAINSVANEVKRELAKEYNLELIDVNAFTEKFLKNSEYSMHQLMPDRLHFGDIGHKYEAGLLFKHISPRTIKVTETSQLDYSNQKVTTLIPSEKLTLANPPTDSFKIFANYAKADANDLKIMTLWVFVDSKKKMSLKAFKSNAESITYVKLNGTTIILDALEKTIGSLEIGLHSLEVYTGASVQVDFKGFKLEQI